MNDGWISRDRPPEEDAIALGYGSDGDTVAEAMLLEDGTTHFTVVSLDDPQSPGDGPSE